MNRNQLSRLTINGFKSIRRCDLELTSLNVLSGPSGVGKSNFIGFVRMLLQMLAGNLQAFVANTYDGKEIRHDNYTHVHYIAIP